MPAACAPRGRCALQRSGADAPPATTTLPPLRTPSYTARPCVPCVQDAPAGAKLIDLPTSCHLTYSTTSDDPRLLAVIDQVPAELWGAKLALQLLANRLQGPDSAFAEYISNLPRGVPGIPTFFRPQAVEALDYPPVVQQVKKRGRWLHEFSTTVLAKLPGTPADPFNGTRVDINALGEHHSPAPRPRNEQSA